MSAVGDAVIVSYGERWRKRPSQGRDDGPGVGLLVGQERREGVAVHRTGEEVALHRWQPSARRRSSWTSPSTPSATTCRPSERAISTMAATIVVSSSSAPTPATNDRSIFMHVEREALQARQRRVAGAEVVDQDLTPISRSASSVERGEPTP